VLGALATIISVHSHHIINILGANPQVWFVHSLVIALTVETDGVGPRGEGTTGRGVERIESRGIRLTRTERSRVTHREAEGPRGRSKPLRHSS